MSTSRLVSAAVLAAVTVASSAQASIVGLWSNDDCDVILGDLITGFQIGTFSNSPAITSLAWTVNPSQLNTPSGPRVNPLYQQGNSAENPFYQAAALRLTFGGLSSVFTWTDGLPVDLDFNVTFYVSDLADATATPLAVLHARGKGTKPTAPPRPGPGDVINGGTGNDVIFGDYIISFNPNQPFTNLDGSPIAAAYDMRTASGASWTGISVVPAPGAAALLGLGGLIATRRRRRS